ncbi:MAG: SNF2-related protein [Desulfuromonadales bacterium]
MALTIAEPIESVFLIAEQDGVYIRSNKGNLESVLEAGGKQLTPLGQCLPLLIPQMLELGYAEQEPGCIRIAYEQFVSLGNEGINAFDDLAPFAPFYIELSTSGTLGRDDFKYHVKYFNGLNQISAPDRTGCFVTHLDKIYQLDTQTFFLIEKIQQFRQLPAETRDSSESLLHFAAIRGLAEGVGAQIDRFITDNKVLIAPTLGIDLVEKDGRVSFAPYIEGVAAENLRRVFFQTSDVEDLFVDDGTGGRIRLIFSPEQQEALRRMTKVRHLGGEAKTKVLRNPTSVFEGVASVVDLEIGDFGPRVRGIGSFPFVSQPVIQRSDTGIFDDPDFSGSGGTGKGKLNAGVICKYTDGQEDQVFFKSKDELIKFNQQVQNAHSNGLGVVNLGDRSIVVDKDFAAGVSNLVKRVTLPSSQRNESEQDESDKKYLLIYENDGRNDEKPEYEERWISDKVDKSCLTLPEQLRPDIALKPHQEDGLRWLQMNYLMEGKNGCLLADDMGLGKTLQILAFSAWLIERGDLTPSGSLNPDAAPWKPILVVTPVMLLENDTWIQDIEKFFKNAGAVFAPWCVLHGKELKDMRVPGLTGQEVVTQRPLLDLDRLRQYRIIFTNYETIVNYQFSFASMKSDWSLVVTDEAQAQKTPKTKISHALKSLAPRFRIACTGTPVETRLLDVWNIMDYLQPGEILGTASNFTKTYEQPIVDNQEGMEETLDLLRERLHYGRDTAFILRREKSETLEGLPKKIEHKITCDLSPLQREYHIDYMNRARQGSEHPFALIQGLMKLYQHPSLIPTLNPDVLDDCNAMKEQCPKLLELLNTLVNIRNKGEKALIFTRSLDMQQLLSRSIYDAIGQRVDIVNGAANRKETATSSTTRKAMINRFKTDKKLSAIILSPEVAGIGLTLVEANHVMHYGRWWNPAKESQATDRAYRIGQERDVHVYQYIATDPKGEFKSFDEKLDALIDRRRKMADDFLAPMPGEQVLQEELYKDLIAESSPREGGRKPVRIDDVRVLTWERFESLIAVTEQQENAKVIVTPSSGDMGIDVVTIMGKQVRLIQCKHRRYEEELGQEVVSEMLNAFDTYRSRFFFGTDFTLKPVLATNGRIPRTLSETCKQKGIDIISGTKLSKLLEEKTCTLADIEFMEATRVMSMSHFAEKVAGLS